jgi:Protein of unknown function (DUF2905)
MEPFRELGRMLLILGVVLAALGALFYFGGRLPFRLGRLPGDIVHRGEHTTFYFPIVTSLLVSIVWTLLFWLFNQFRR